MTPVPRGFRTWAAGGLCALGVCASLLSLTGPVVPGRWLPVAAFAVLALAALIAGVRAVTAVWWAPSLVGLGAVVLGVLAAYASPPGRLQLVPSTGSFGRLGDAFRAGLEYADVSRPPVDSTRPLELLIVGGALLVLLVADLIAIGLAAPAWSGLALLALWLPGITLGRASNFLAFAGASSAYLLLLALTAAPPPGSRGTRLRTDETRRAGLAVAGAATVTVASLALGPVAGLAPWFASLQLPSFGTVSVGSLQLAQDLNLRESLGARSSEVVLTYRAEPVTVGPLRVFTLRDFDGDNWSRDTRARDIAADPAVLWPARDLADRPPDEEAPTASTVTVTVRGLREERLPVPVMPRTVDATGRWSYDAERDEVNRVGVTRPGLEYSMQVDLLDLTAANLRRPAAEYPPDMEEYLAVPQTSHTDDIVAAAAEITAGAAGPYEQALALQSYLRSIENFTYDTEVPPASSDDAVWDFLGSRIGYCVQFGTAMTILARTLDIPARLGVGFLPGELDTNTGSYVVTGRDSHAWPELYFPGSGWVRFEPTPAVQSQQPPPWADPFAAAGAEPVPDERPDGAGVVPTPVPSTAPLAQAPGAAGESSGASVRYAIGGGVLVLLLAGLGWWLGRRRLARVGDPDPELAWARLRSRLGALGISWSDSHTPRQVVALVTDQIELRNGAPLGLEAATALRALARAVQDARYAPHRTATHDGLDRDALVVLHEVSAKVKVPASAS